MALRAQIGWLPDGVERQPWPVVVLCVPVGAGRGLPLQRWGLRAVRRAATLARVRPRRSGIGTAGRGARRSGGIRRLYWAARYRTWRASAEEQLSPGYTVLVPVPGDLPVFCRLALAACNSQRSSSRRATLVIPDAPSARVHRIVESWKGSWNGELAEENIRGLERWLLPRMKNAGHNYAVQLITGISATKSSHVIFHDADLFPLHEVLFERQYERCRDRQLACLGLSPVWDEWFEAHGRKLAATWDLFADVRWLRSFRPAEHISQDETLWGEAHSFDVTLLAQAKTRFDLIDVTSEPDDFIHFNYVIGTFRRWQRTKGEMIDDRFLVLLVHLLSEMFGEPTGGPKISVEQMGANLGRADLRLRHPDRESGRANYEEFRTKLGLALLGPWAETGMLDRANGLLEPFDSYYGVGR